MQLLIPDWALFAEFTLDLLMVDSRLAQSSEVLSSWIKNTSQTAESNYNMLLNDRLIALILLTELLQQSHQVQTPIFEKTVEILKRASRDIRRTLITIAIELLFRLLGHFARNKMPQAPTLFKTLTFLFVEFFWEVDLRE